MENKLVTAKTIGAGIEASAAGPVLLEFWAPWAAPCRSASPALAEARRKHKNLTVLRVNVDTEKELVRQYNVKVVPTYVFVDVPGKGEVAKESSRIVGAKSRSEMLRAIGSKATRVQELETK